MAHNDNFDFKAGDDVVYPAHGVGCVEGVETQTIAGMELSLYVVSFAKDRMRLKIPVAKAEISGLRKLSSNERLDSAMETLKGRSRVRRTMWSRRAQEYATKINSGDPVAIAEVLRDLKRSNDDTEQSYSERQIYQSALERLAREVAAVDEITEIMATEKLENIMGKIKVEPANNDEKDAQAAA
ncbi:MAG: CarD family transcriptional regulator [Zetaproteobacteria bacterium]|nr:MAG: CarD family transcriptional regulator [Zetaproteobacteria bacterium]